MPRPGRICRPERDRIQLRAVSMGAHLRLAAGKGAHELSRDRDQERPLVPLVIDSIEGNF